MLLVIHFFPHPVPGLTLTYIWTSYNKPYTNTGVNNNLNECCIVLRCSIVRIWVLCMPDHGHDSHVLIWNTAIIIVISYTCAPSEIMCQIVCECSVHSQLWCQLGCSSRYPSNF